VGNVSPSDYLRAILEREAVDMGTGAALRGLEADIERLVARWAGRNLLEVYPSGGYEKGMANASGTSIDFLVSLSPGTPYSMYQIYESLHGALLRGGLEPVRRPVSLGFEIGNVVVDLIPAKRSSLDSDIHELYSTRRSSSLATNLGQHLLDAVEEGRQEEVRILKLWRDQAGLDFPSFYLELATVNALEGRPRGELADNVWQVLGYLGGPFVSRGLLDPANANNAVSSEMSTVEKRAIAAAAASARMEPAWSKIVA
jgi:hypothetical protein